MTNISDKIETATLRAIRAKLDLTQEQLAERLGVSFATVNRWEGGATLPQKAARRTIAALAVEAGIELEGDDSALAVDAAAGITRRRRTGTAGAPTTKPMEQMLWDAACSIRGEKDAPKFKDYLLPLLFLKRLSDVFDDEIERLAEDYGDRVTALEIAEADHSLLRFYLPPEARWGVISGRKEFAWAEKDKPRDIGEHLTKAVRAVVKHNPELSGVIDFVDFAAERNGERDINPAKLRAVVETFSDPRYRLGLADVQPDFLGRAYEYLLRKFAEGSGQSAGEFFTPTEVGFLMANIMRPRPGEECHDYACGSAGLLVKLQLVARELDPTSKVPLKLTGQELQAESYAVAKMNGIIHDVEIELARGDTMINPKFRTAEGKLRTFDIVVANPMWNQPFNPDVFKNDPFDRFSGAGGTTAGNGDWAWLQHTYNCLAENGRAAVVLDTGAVTRGSGLKSDDKERGIRRWFVDHDLIDGIILLPDNLFYNTTAAGIIVVLSKRKPTARKGNIILFNASRHFKKGRPKNYIPELDIRELASIYTKGEPIVGELTVVDLGDIQGADYNLNPGRWVSKANSDKTRDPAQLVQQLIDLIRTDKTSELVDLLQPILIRMNDKQLDKQDLVQLAASASPNNFCNWTEKCFSEVITLQRGFDLPAASRTAGEVPVYGSNGIVGFHDRCPADLPKPGLMVGRSGSVGIVNFASEKYWPLNTTLVATDYHGNDPRFLRYWLEEFPFQTYAQGVSVPTLNRNSFADSRVKVPAPSDQSCIAAILDFISTEVANAKHRYELLDTLLRSFRRRLVAAPMSSSERNE